MEPYQTEPGSRGSDHPDKDPQIPLCLPWRRLPGALARMLGRCRGKKGGEGGREARGDVLGRQQAEAVGSIVAVA